MFINFVLKFGKAMWILVIGIVILGIVSLILGYLYNRRREKNGETAEEEIVIPDNECCGQHEVCEKDSLLAGISKGIEYYNDEELDRFRGRPSDSYSQEEADEFSEVLYTMQENEVAGWCRSLQLRGIELPDQLKDEVFLIVGEIRTLNNHI